MFFKKCSNIKFRENSSSGAELFPAEGLMDRLGEANSRFSQYATSPKKDSFGGDCVCLRVRPSPILPTFGSYSDFMGLS